ncbi:MAG: PAS domain S-box protein [Steroidobacteraceae bacterium]
MLIAFAAIFGSGALGFALTSMGATLSLPLLPSGFAVAAMYRWGLRMWPAVFAAGFAIDMSTHQPLIGAVGVGIGLAGGAALTAWILEWRGFDPSFGRARDVPLFIVAAAVGMTLAPAAGYLGFYLADSRAEVGNPVNWLRWWINTAAGVILLGPILVPLGRRSLALFIGHWKSAAAWMLSVAVCCYGILAVSTDPLSRPPMALFAILLVVVGAIRFGLVPAAGASFAISAVTAYGIAFGLGAFGQIDELHGLVTLWTLSAALTGLTLIVTALLAEREAASLERLRAEQRYAQIFNGSPQPIWVHDRDTLRFLMVNEAAVRLYGWNRPEFQAMTVAALIPPEENPLPAQSGDITPGSVAEPFETRHLTRDGRLLQVEVWTRSINLGGQPAELVFAVDVTERRALGDALVEAVSSEQRRIGQEMHDGLGQELTGLALSARALANRAARERDAIAGDLDQLALLATSCIQDARLIVQGLSPLTDADGSLEAALEALARNCSLSGVPVRFRVRHEEPVGIDLKARNHLYRIAQEAVQNALKHAGASAVEIDLCARDGSIRLAVSDDGHGLSNDSAGDSGIGLGMRTMRFRSSAIGGRLRFLRGANGGHTVVCEAPQARIPAQRHPTRA